MSIFRQLPWKLTLTYTIVTVSALLVIILILGGFLFAQMFLPGSYLNPEQLIEGWLNSTVPSTYLMWSQILTQSPVDLELVQRYLNDPESNITGSDLFRIGALQFSVTSRASIRVLILETDGTLLGTSTPDDPVFRSALGKRLDPTLVPGLEAPLKAALAGDTDPGRLYTVLKPNEQYVMAAPIFSRASGDESELVGALVDSVREELTNLVHELRPQAMDGQDFSETLKEYAIDWSRRSGIELVVPIIAT